MIDVVIPLGTGSKHNNIELRYCLRSIYKYLTGYRNIYIVGEHPGFDGDFIHIPAQDHGYNIQDNIRRKIEIACAHPDISRKFYFTNDDHILLKPVHAPDLPNYYHGDLHLAWLRKRQNGSYKMVLQRTREVLEAKEYATYQFDIHVPIVYDKVFFPYAMSLYPWKTEKWGFAIKSLYCNTMMVPATYLESDCQIGHNVQSLEELLGYIDKRFVFAFTEGACNQLMFNMLEERFPHTSE